MLSNAEITEAITNAIVDLLGDLHDEDDGIDLDATFSEVGLNSLMLARLVIALETDLGVDPFTDSDRSIVDVRTVGDLAGLYAQASGTGQVAAEAAR
ncbi:acyl carrier protein [Myceligenerans indicum]|uniref:Acyl carrier protein n=1 Tax=Myceligenerans indicum TaxID=2593663 RepID=A0ABS1LQL9_9MICO|nr:acyl carrier protein [Myceligenerans indicum]MBL0888364.1 acyl carrier protein [Myceligenerans indicum]